MPGLRTSHLRRRVLEQLRAGPATGPELVAGAFDGRGERARKLLLRWHVAGFIARELLERTPGRPPPPYRYTITALGEAVLEADEL